MICYESVVKMLKIQHFSYIFKLASSHAFCVCDEVFFFQIKCHNFYLKKKLDKFVLKIWISRRVSYFVGILSGVGNIFLLSYPQVLSLLSVKFKGISEPHKNSIQKNEYCFFFFFFFLREKKMKNFVINSIYNMI